MPEVREVPTKPFELSTRFNPNHVYSLTEANDLVSRNNSASFLSLGWIKDLGQISADNGFDNDKIVQAGATLLENFKGALPFKVHGAIPVLLKSADGLSTKLTFLTAAPHDEVEGTNIMYQQNYYSDFEENPAGNKKLVDSLPTWEQSSEFSKAKQKTGSRFLILGSSYSGNYSAVVEQVQRNNIDGDIVVMDYNRAPLETLRSKVKMRQQDSIVQADITRMPFDLSQKFDVMYGDFILSCFHPAKVSEFFSSVSSHLSNDGALFLSLSCNNFFQANGSEEIPFAFSATVRDLNGKQQEHYYRGTYTFYQKLAEQNGMNFRVIKKQVREDNPTICDYWLAITKTK